MDSDDFYVPDRCRCPVHSPCGPMRRRRDLRGLLRESVLGERSQQRAVRQRDRSDSLFGIPADYIFLIDKFKGGRHSTHNVQVENRAETAAGQKSKDGGKDSACDKKATSSEGKLASPSSKTSTSEEQASTTAVARSSDDVFTRSVVIGDYEPENVKVSVDGRKVTVKARRDHRDVDSGGLVRHSAVEYRFLVPENTDTESLTSSYGTDGTLSITAKRKSDSKEAAIKQATEQRPEQTTEVISESVADDKEEGSQDEAEEEKRMEVELDVHQEDNGGHEDEAVVDENTETADAAGDE